MDKKKKESPLKAYIIHKLGGLTRSEVRQRNIRCLRAGHMAALKHIAYRMQALYETDERQYINELWTFIQREKAKLMTDEEEYNP